MFNIPPPIEFDWQLHPIFKLLLYSMNISNDTEIIPWGYKIEIIFVINISFFYTRVMQIKQKEEDENLLKNTLILIVLNWTIVCLVQNIYIYIYYIYWKI